MSPGSNHSRPGGKGVSRARPQTSLNAASRQLRVPNSDTFLPTALWNPRLTGGSVSGTTYGFGLDLCQTLGEGTIVAQTWKKNPDARVLRDCTHSFVGAARRVEIDVDVGRPATIPMVPKSSHWIPLTFMFGSSTKNENLGLLRAFVYKAGETGQKFIWFFVFVLIRDLCFQIELQREPP